MVWPREGNGALMASLAAALARQGSELRCQTGCKRIVVEDGCVRGVVVSNNQGEEERIDADIIVSNAGPDKTFELAGGEVNFETKLHRPPVFVPMRQMPRSFMSALLWTGL